MDPSIQNIAIAEACGWKTETYWQQPIEPGDFPITTKPPDFLNCLNAMSQARDKLITIPELKIKWVNKLRDVVGLTATRRNKLGQPSVSDIDLLFATAQQLAQTLLQTLNLWKDEH